ncbi:SpaA isopeptide-forming pilin-related protein [Listeria cossartiae subsp. cayugensis]|uniref:SpaA isopeptide-forming pilin-related protein n=1 Tax=Listeria cossartiae subsp. cayugensis TaxID=2713505 RepID=A0ABU2IRM2_9LIST|nr:SpaA isopeptide-forming pilin-related protein [Listeria cossartiae]MDT0067278.1 SpaA isopeptide-forming pilin-related protein [Listeria cossartiae subsp. cayugensis]MDT0081194.1 SpaA isopeptide-forming pilin-related protein [Listeria cossartiae subsp. cayugensis]MDT0084030.1 SpaA isopeptide-forming pilin-related protein [Listeria cossartiae subsp. cayugensis]MDT0089502.1 SpaA isopeptide-forming pilin-related protein [Listeria cossartiae subsp. cayugensis]MDT0100641.1 SpaA isopeptide-forming
MKKKHVQLTKVSIAMLLILSLIIQIFSPLITAKAAENNGFKVGQTDSGEAVMSSKNPRPLLKSTGSSSGSWSANYGGYTTSTSYINVGGKVAFCIDPAKDFPVNINYAESVYTDAGVYNILAYGYPHNGTSEKNYVDTYVALNYYLGHFDSPAMAADSGVKYLLEKARTKPAAMGKFSITNKSQKATWNSTTKRQETGYYQHVLESDVNVTQTISLPANITLVTRSGKEYKGNVTINADEDFKLTAPADYDKTISFDVDTNLRPKSALMFNPSSSNVQRLVSAGGVRDPISVTDIKATFEAQVGDLKIKKTGSDNRTLANAEYDVKDSSGKVVAHVKTTADGTITAKDLLIGDYTIVETKAPAGYTIDRTPRKVTVRAAETTLLNVTNKAISFQVKVKKADSETGDTAQGDASLISAKYGIYEDAAATKLLDEIIIGQDLTATSKKMLLGGASKTVYVKETKAPTGYNIDKTIYPVKIDQKDDVTELLLGNATSKDTVIKGGFELIKFANKPLLQSMLNTLPEGQKQPLFGAEFTATLKSTGVVAQIQTTDLNGAASFKNLPYGTYKISETKTPTGYKSVADFEVTISEEGQKFHYILEDKVIEAKVKILKKDMETGKVIPRAGATFKIKDSEGNFISQHINYPTEKDLTEFTTAADGTLVLPETLVFGDYTLVEVKAPHGYLLNKEEISFTVSEENDEDMITLSFSDAPAKGKVRGVKTKEIIDTEKSTSEKVVYKQVPATNIEFDVVAKENITTPDGTVRAKKGTVVDHLKTDKDGKFESTKELYLGKYQLVETNLPSEYRELKPINFTLNYKDDQTQIVWANVNVKNMLKKGEVEVSKKDITGDNELPGATLNIKGKDIDLTWVSTNENKKYTLPDGDYVLTEKIPNPGYKLNEKAVPFTVKNGQLTKVTMHNEKLPVKKGFLPTTGDSSLDLMLYSLGTILTAVGIYLLVQLRRKRFNQN